jgi:hypothetical protein
MTKTSPQQDTQVMTLGAKPRYSPSHMDGLQHTRAFVVQFRTATDFATGRVAGRVEHIASGRSAHFESSHELLEIFARVLSDTQPTASAEY